MLRRVDTSFDVAGARSYRAVNRDSFMVDLIAPAPKDPVRPRTGRNRIGGDDDLIAAEIFGLAWLVNSPGFEPMSIGEDGFPVRLACPDPRAFAYTSSGCHSATTVNPRKSAAIGHRRWPSSTFCGRGCQICRSTQRIFRRSRKS